MSDAEENALAHFGFLSRRPLLVVVNVPESEAAAPVPGALQEAAAALGAEAIALSAEVEAEIAELPADEQPDYDGHERGQGGDHACDPREAEERRAEEGQPATACRPGRRNSSSVSGQRSSG